MTRTSWTALLGSLLMLTSPAVATATGADKPSAGPPSHWQTFVSWARQDGWTPREIADVRGGAWAAVPTSFAVLEPDRSPGPAPPARTTTA